MLSPYIKLYANDILLNEKMKALSDKDLGSLVRCMAHASNNGGSIPTDPVALGMLLSIRPSSAAKLLPMLRTFFTDFKEISPIFLEDFEQFLESLFKDFGKSEGRIYSTLVLDSLGPYSKVVNNNREIAAKGAGRNHPQADEKSNTTRSTGGSTTFTSTNNTVVGLSVNGEQEFYSSAIKVQTETKNQVPGEVIEQIPIQDDGSTTQVRPEKGTPSVKVAKAWNATVKAVGRADLKVTNSEWAEIDPLIKQSLMKHSEQEHLDAFAYGRTWGSQWWREAKRITLNAFLKKIPEYAQKYRVIKTYQEKHPKHPTKKFTPADLATILARHPRGAEVWEKVQRLFPRIQVADATAMMDVLLEDKVTPDEFIRSAEHKFGSVSGSEFMPSFGKWLSECGYMVHTKAHTIPTKAQEKPRQDITGGVDIIGNAKRAAEEKKREREASKEITND